MPWVHFVENFDWHPHKKITIAFKQGMTLLVHTKAAAQAIAEGKAVEVERPNNASR